MDSELVPDSPTVNLTVPESSLPLWPMEPEEWPLPTCWYKDAACSERRGSSTEISLNIGEAVGSSDTLRLNFWAATDGILTRCPSLSFLSLEPPSGMPASPSISPPRKKTWTNGFTQWWSNGINMQHPKHSVQFTCWRCILKPISLTNHECSSVQLMQGTQKLKNIKKSLWLCSGFHSQLVHQLLLCSKAHFTIFNGKASKQHEPTCQAFVFCSLGRTTRAQHWKTYH